MYKKYKKSNLKYYKPDIERVIRVQWMTPDDSPELTPITYRKAGSDNWRITNIETGETAILAKAELMDLLPEAGSDGVGEIWGCEAQYIFGEQAAETA